MRNLFPPISPFECSIFNVGHTRFLNFHGEPNARRQRNVSVHGDPIYRRTLFIKTFSLFLFSAPDIHLKTLQNYWVDGIMHRSMWQETMKKLGEGWDAFVLAVSDGLHVIAP